VSRSTRLSGAKRPTKKRRERDREFGDAEECGCGSGKPYATCCKKTRVRYTRDGWGRIHKTILLDQDGRAAFDEAMAAFKKTFGRAPGRRDRVLLAPYRHSPDDFRRMFLKIADEAGTPKHLVYAYVKTDGLMLTEANEELASPQDVEDVKSAVDEYFDALDQGIDLLEPEITAISEALSLVEENIDDVVVHLGSYADKAPREIRRNLPLFFQFLLIARSYQVIKTIADKRPDDIGNEAIASLRTVYECTLLIMRLEIEPSYADTLLAQALHGSELYSYKLKKNGKIDYSVIVEHSTGRNFESRPSFSQCANLIGVRHAELFNIAYPILSSQVHFNAFGMIQRYRSTGSFLMWDDVDRPIVAVISLITILYLILSIALIKRCTKTIRRDALFIFNRLYCATSVLMDAIDIEDYDIDPSVMFFVIRTFELFANRDFSVEEN
jgi:hypothetical protein